MTDLLARLLPRRRRTAQTGIRRHTAPAAVWPVTPPATPDWWAAAGGQTAVHRILTPPPAAGLHRAADDEPVRHWATPKAQVGRHRRELLVDATAPLDLADLEATP